MLLNGGCQIHAYKIRRNGHGSVSAIDQHGSLNTLRANLQKDCYHIKHGRTAVEYIIYYDDMLIGELIKISG